MLKDELFVTVKSLALPEALLQKEAEGRREAAAAVGSFNRSCFVTGEMHQRASRTKSLQAFCFLSIALNV